MVFFCRPSHQSNLFRLKWSIAPWIMISSYMLALYHWWYNIHKKSMNTAWYKQAYHHSPYHFTNHHTTAYAPIKIPIKDDPPVTPTLKTLCTLDTCSSHSTHINNDAILSIMIWNQPIVQYQILIQSFASTHNWSCEHPSTAVWHALIGVYDKLLNPPKLPCLLSL
jgi:hypothetical protein